MGAFACPGLFVPEGRREVEADSGTLLTANEIAALFLQSGGAPAG